jgi:hypothetical protein
VTLQQVIPKKILEKTMKDINKQVLETKYTFNLGQLLWVILDIEQHTFNSIPSQLILPKSIVVSIAIDHQMAII